MWDWLVDLLQGVVDSLVQIALDLLAIGVGYVEQYFDWLAGIYLHIVALAIEFLAEWWPPFIEWLWGVAEDGYDWFWLKSAAFLEWFWAEMEARGVNIRPDALIDAWNGLQPIYQPVDWLLPVTESVTVFAGFFTLAFGVRAFRWIKSFIPTLGD